MYALKPDKINITLVEKYNSTSGKYTIFYGEHFDASGNICYDVGALNNFNGELTRRHYELKWEAEEFWEVFKSKMRGGGQYEEDEPDEPRRIITPE